MACYVCESCGFELYQPVNGKEFTPISVCSTPECKENNTAGKLQLKPRYSKFVKFQEVKIQEVRRIGAMVMMTMRTGEYYLDLR